ncbi:MAG: hypothetical protein C9356_03655 [Oleiphilus sp.]|nr:MAG: hypothetical protein C9356_03655 [Oleiphilus sp.]
MLDKILQQPSILQLKQKVELLPARDRMALKVLALVVLALFLYAALWQPARSYMMAAKAEVEQRKDLLALVQDNKAALKQLVGQSGSSSQKLDSQQLVSTVTNLAKRQGLNLKRFEPSGQNEVKVWVDNASFDKLIQWLSLMHSSVKVRVEQISLEKEDAEGLVNARITLSS